MGSWSVLPRDRPVRCAGRVVPLSIHELEDTCRKGLAHIPVRSHPIELSSSIGYDAGRADHRHRTGQINKSARTL